MPASRAFTFEPVGVVHSARTRAEDDHWDAVRAHVALDAARFSPEAIAGLDTFSHVEVLFLMNQVDPAKIESAARHPRNNPAWPKIGIFAQRGKNRPSLPGWTT